MYVNSRVDTTAATKRHLHKYSSLMTLQCAQYTCIHTYIFENNYFSALLISMLYAVGSCCRRICCVRSALHLLCIHFSHCRCKMRLLANRQLSFLQSALSVGTTNQIKDRERERTRTEGKTRLYVRVRNVKRKSQFFSPCFLFVQPNRSIYL